MVDAVQQVVQLCLVQSFLCILLVLQGRYKQFRSFLLSGSEGVPLCSYVNKSCTFFWMARLYPYVLQELPTPAFLIVLLGWIIASGCMLACGFERKRRATSRESLDIPEWSCWCEISPSDIQTLHYTRGSRYRLGSQTLQDKDSLEWHMQTDRKHWRAKDNGLGSIDLYKK